MSDRVRLSTIIPVQYRRDSRTLIKNDFRNISKSTEGQRGGIFSKYIGQRRRNYNSENSAAKDSG